VNASASSIAARADIVAVAAVAAEADAEQGDRAWRQGDEAALLVVAVGERLVMQRLRDDGAHAAPGDLAGERHGVAAHRGVGRTQLRRHGVAEAGLLRQAGGQVVRAVDVQEDRPRVDVHVAGRGGADEVAERLLAAAARPQRRAPPQPRLGPEVHLAAPQERQPAAARRREQVARRVVGGGQRDAVHAGPALEVVEHRVGARIRELRREAEVRRQHPHPPQGATATTTLTASTPREPALRLACAESRVCAQHGGRTGERRRYGRAPTGVATAASWRRRASIPVATKRDVRRPRRRRSIRIVEPARYPAPENARSDEVLPISTTASARR
jgi:hypothetical protein